VGLDPAPQTNGLVDAVDRRLDVGGTAVDDPGSPGGPISRVRAAA
jgi:hypothetical protein